MTDLADDDIVLVQSEITENTPLEEALKARADVIAMTQETHDACLFPNDPGGLSHAERAALATRIARHHRHDGLCAHYRELMGRAGADDDVAKMADPDLPCDDARRSVIVAYTDLVTVKPSEAGAEDIDALKAVGVDDADIVRLSELNAFLAYQLRLIAGLKLMKDMT